MRTLDGGRSLDATCSVKRVWPRYATVRSDISLDADPDVRADARKLPFRDGTFDEVFCDPPHLIGYKNSQWGRQLAGRGPEFSRFGFFENRKQWLAFCAASGAEFRRVLKPGGLLRYKVPDGSRSHGRQIRHTDVLALEGFTVASDRVVRGRGPRAGLNRALMKRASWVHYITLRKAG